MIIIIIIMGRKEAERDGETRYIKGRALGEKTKRKPITIISIVIEKGEGEKIKTPTCKS